MGNLQSLNQGKLNNEMVVILMSTENENDNYRYDRSWVEIEEMLDRAERKMNFHETESHLADTQTDKVYHIRNFKALQGVSKALRWVLGDVRIDDPLE